MAIDNIYVYYCDMRQFNVGQDELHRVLNQTDLRRYRGFKNTSRQNQFVMSRWLMKQCLKQLFAQATSDDYQLSDYSRWNILDQSNSYSVSISHSGHFIAVAIAAFPCSIGLDIEQHKSRNFTELVKIFGTPSEQNLVNNHPEQQLSFYRLWTAKEAFLKVTQSSIDHVFQENLGKCLHHKVGQVAGYHYLTGELGEGKYSYAVMTDSAAKIQVQEFQLHH
ncbi:4'-phosphopantetheinyl transferase superfamily protein [uncultured Paraglaciecola sp.]|uniref:4'-phosphopantetheinyl transferase family protein n=1 Tax=uncultured Paraglaciecola sp. TaxID=1765024 RepID=UPI0030D8891D